MKLHHIGIACSNITNIFFLKKRKLIFVIDKIQNNKIFFDYNKENNLWYEYIVPLNNKSTIFNALKNKEMLIHHLGFYTKDINKIKKISISKVPVYSVPKEFEALYGDVANDTSAENPFKVIYATAKFGSYQYAASTLKQKERAAAKAAELEKQKGPQQQGTNEPVIEPEVTTTQQQTVEPQVPQQQNKPVVEPEVTTTQQQEPEVEEPEVEVPEVEKINKLLNNKIKK